MKITKKYLFKYLKLYSSGFIFCMISDVFFAIANYFVRKVFYYRSKANKERDAP